MRPGTLNLITDVPGLKVGNAQDAHIKSGVTVLVGDEPFVAAVNVMGGAPGTRETDLLAPDKAVEQIDALVLSGGSAFGLEAASGVTNALARAGRGFQVGPAQVPIVPAAILFDLINGGDKNWGQNPYSQLGETAFGQAQTEFALGSAGAGTGATSAGLKGGLGSASLALDDGVMVGALVAANPTGQMVVGPKGQFWAAPFELNSEFGGRGVFSGPFDLDDMARTKTDFADMQMGGKGTNTSLAIVATNVTMTNAQVQRMATAAHDGFARAIMPAHTPVDGDLVFGVSTGQLAQPEQIEQFISIGHAAAICVARATARGVYAAKAAQGDLFPTWSERFG